MRPYILRSEQDGLAPVPREHAQHNVSGGAHALAGLVACYEQS